MMAIVIVSNLMELTVPRWPAPMTASFTGCNEAMDGQFGMLGSAVIVFH